MSPPSSRRRRWRPRSCTTKALPLAHTSDSLNVRLDGPDDSRIVWVIADPIDARGWSSARVQTIERLLPHLRQFVRVRQALVDPAFRIELEPQFTVPAPERFGRCVRTR